MWSTGCDRPHQSDRKRIRRAGHHVRALLITLCQWCGIVGSSPFTSFCSQLQRSRTSSRPDRNGWRDARWTGSLFYFLSCVRGTTTTKIRCIVTWLWVSVSLSRWSTWQTRSQWSDAACCKKWRRWWPSLRPRKPPSPQRSHFKKCVNVGPNGVDDAYRQNIQIADLNALNAALAVIRWKKFCGFYVDLEQEHQSNFTIDGNIITNSYFHET